MPEKPSRPNTTSLDVEDILATLRQRGITQRNISEKLELSWNHLHKGLGNPAVFTVNHVRTLAGALRITAGELTEHFCRQIVAQRAEPEGSTAEGA